MSPDIISRLHEADLLNRYSPDAQKLDLVELAAVYESLPAVFLNDNTGRKQQVRVKLENDIHKLLEERNKQPSSSADKFRNRVYQSCPPPFAAEKLFADSDVLFSAGGNNNSVDNPLWK